MDREELNRKLNKIVGSSEDEVDIDDQILVCISIGKWLIYLWKCHFHQIFVTSSKSVESTKLWVSGARQYTKKFTEIWHQIWDKNDGENICHWSYFQIPWALSELPANWPGVTSLSGLIFVYCLAPETHSDHLVDFKSIEWIWFQEMLTLCKELGKIFKKGNYLREDSY